MTQGKQSLVRRTFSTKRHIERKGTFRQSGKWDCEAASFAEDSPSEGRWKRLKHSESFLQGRIDFNLQFCDSANINLGPHNVAPEKNLSNCNTESSVYENTNNQNNEKQFNRVSFLTPSNEKLCHHEGRRSCVHYVTNSNGVLGGLATTGTVATNENNQWSAYENKALSHCRLPKICRSKTFFGKVWPVSTIKEKLTHSKIRESVSTPKRTFSFSKKRTHHLTPKTSKIFPKFSPVPELIFSKAQSPPFEFIRYNSYRLTKSLASNRFVRNKLMSSIRRLKGVNLSPLLTSAQIRSPEQSLPCTPNTSHNSGPVSEKIGSPVTDRRSREQLANTSSNSLKECSARRGDFVRQRLEHNSTEKGIFSQGEKATRNRQGAVVKIIRAEPHVTSVGAMLTCVDDYEIHATEICRVDTIKIIRTIQSRLKEIDKKSDVNVILSENSSDNSLHCRIRRNLCEFEVFSKLSTDGVDNLGKNISTSAKLGALQVST